MARLFLVLAALCSVTLPWTAAAFAQDLGRGRGAHSIEGGPVDVAQLTQRAEFVGHGFVTARRAAWIGRVIYTLYDLSVQETLKGAPRISVVVAVAGGALGNVRLMVPGAPDLQVGQQVVFFTTTLQGTTLTPVGTFDGIVPVRRGGPADAGLTVSPRGAPESLDAFLEEVRRLGGR
jgi:hypothetical protein